MNSTKLLILLALLASGLIKDSNAQQRMNTTQSLDSKQQSIVIISAFTAKGDLSQLQKALSEGLHAGLTINEIKEVLVQLYAYTGFPRSLNALQTFADILKQRKQNGIKDELGKEPSPLPTDKGRFQFGTEMQTKLVGQPVKGEVFEFAPAIDQFLKEHLFGDIFGRDNLDWKNRELATIAALASLGGVDNQLRSHFGVGIYNGLSAPQLTHLVSIIQSKVGLKQGNAAGKVLQTVLKERQVNNITDKIPEKNILSTTKSDKMNNTNNPVAATIFSKGEKAPTDYFTGTAWVNILVPRDQTGTYSIGNVVFEPGCRNNWHIHPAGQTLIVTDGNGWYQEKGKPARRISTGDVVVIPSGIEHWHGAAKDSGLTHLAITNLSTDGAVKWLERVTDEEYNSLKSQMN